MFVYPTSRDRIWHRQKCKSGSVILAASIKWHHCVTWGFGICYNIPCFSKEDHISPTFSDSLPVKMRSWATINRWILISLGVSGGSDSKESAHNAGVPGWVRSLGEGNGNPLQYSCLENSMDSGSWWVTVHGVAKRHNWVTNSFNFLLKKV